MRQGSGGPRCWGWLPPGPLQRRAGSPGLSRGSTSDGRRRGSCRAFVPPGPGAAPSSCVQNVLRGALWPVTTQTLSGRWPPSSGGRQPPSCPPRPSPALVCTGLHAVTCGRGCSLCWGTPTPTSPRTFPLTRLPARCGVSPEPLKDRLMFPPRNLEMWPHLERGVSAHVRDRVTLGHGGPQIH